MIKLILPLGMLAGLAANATPISFQSADRQVTLIELYTSEGCSSCPPAESWLSQRKDAPGLWKDFVPVAFHVDYWDRLGWRDQWSGKQYTERQYAYAAAFGSDSVYTPEFIVNGKEWRDWSGQNTVPAAPDRKVGVLTVDSADGRRWQATFTPAPGSAGLRDKRRAFD